MNREKCLSQLPLGEEGTVARLESCGAIRRRFLEIGIVPGTCIGCVGVSPLGDPLLFLVRGRKIAVRRRDAMGIIIE